MRETAPSPHISESHAPRRLDVLHKLRELGKTGQRQFLGAHTDALHRRGGIAVADAEFDNDVQRAAQHAHGVVEGGGARLPGEAGCPIKAIAAGEGADVPFLQPRPTAQKRVHPLLVVSAAARLEGGVARDAGSEGSQGFTEEYLAASGFELALGGLAVGFLEIAQAQLGNREHGGIETAADDLAVNPNPVEIDTRRFIADQVSERSLGPELNRPPASTGLWIAFALFSHEAISNRSI